MSLRADIYLLPGSASSDCVDFCLRLSEKALALGHDIHIVARGRGECDQISRALWNNPAEIFRPNLVIDELEAADKALVDATRISISEAASSASHGDLVILMPGTYKQNSSNFERITLVAPNDPESLQLARVAYKNFNQLTDTVNIHDLRNTP